MPENNDITRLLEQWPNDEEARGEVMDQVHGKLLQLARSQLRGERAELTLETRDLINEAFLKLIDVKEVEWQGRSHFYRVAAKMMRRILIDHARHRGYQKRGGGVRPEAFVEELHSGSPAAYVALDDALETLAASDPKRAELVELRFFGGFSNEEIAEMEGVSIATIGRRWRVTRAWLFKALEDRDDP